MSKSTMAMHMPRGTAHCLGALLLLLSPRRKTRVGFGTGELLSLRQLKTPVKIVVFKNNPWRSWNSK